MRYYFLNPSEACICFDQLLKRKQFFSQAEQIRFQALIQEAWSTYSLDRIFR